MEDNETSSDILDSSSWKAIKMMATLSKKENQARRPNSSFNLQNTPCDVTRCRRSRARFAAFSQLSIKSHMLFLVVICTSCNPFTGAWLIGFSLVSDFLFIFDFVDRKTCSATNECLPNGGRGPCSHICYYTPGTYVCQCPNGYTLGSNQKTCLAQDCGTPVLPNCLSPTFSDHFGQACKKVIATCATGTTLNNQCRFSCPTNFNLAKITNKRLPFAKVFNDANFDGPVRMTTCNAGSSSSPASSWSSANLFKDYYCRRTNDPPSDILLSKTSIKEHSAIGSTVGIISAPDPLLQQTTTVTVEQSAGHYFFQAQGNKLVNTWIPRYVMFGMYILGRQRGALLLEV